MPFPSSLLCGDAQHQLIPLEKAQGATLAQWSETQFSVVYHSPSGSAGINFICCWHPSPVVSNTQLVGAIFIRLSTTTEARSWAGAVL